MLVRWSLISRQKVEQQAWMFAAVEHMRLKQWTSRVSLTYLRLTHFQVWLLRMLQLVRLARCQQSSCLTRSLSMSNFRHRLSHLSSCLDRMSWLASYPKHGARELQLSPRLKSSSTISTLAVATPCMVKLTGATFLLSSQSRYSAS